jgi:hypothetical protein
VVHRIDDPEQVRHQGRERNDLGGAHVAWAATGLAGARRQSSNTVTSESAVSTRGR